MGRLREQCQGAPPAGRAFSQGDKSVVDEVLDPNFVARHPHSVVAGTVITKATRQRVSWQDGGGVPITNQRVENRTHRSTGTALPLA